jgi:hypothetical protein
MKKFTSLLIGLSLALAGAAFAQQTEETPGKKQGTTEKAGKRGGNATATEQGATTGAEQGTGKGHKAKGANAAESNVSGQTTGGVNTETGAGKGKGRARTETSATGTETGANGQTGAGATTETGAGKGHGKNRARVESSAATGATGTSASTEASATVPPTGKHAGRGEKGMKAGAGANANVKAAPSASAAPTVAAAASAAPSVAATGTTGANANVAATGGTTTHVEKQKVEQVKQQAQTIKQQHVNFKAQPRPDRVPAVTFNVNYRLQGSDRWSGPQYEVFRSYHPERHDRGWYHSRYQRVELIGGGYYYWNNNGYWYPAWGYDPGHEYYAYDTPIYVGRSAAPPDRVIADVQSELQEMGYYQGEVDGLLGPMTRQALTDYQADQGLQVTAVIDEPTLDSLGMG